MRKKQRHPGIITPSSAFTPNVMQQIELEEMALSNIIKHHALLSPSAEFSTLLLPKLQTSKTQVYVPVISKTIWIGIAALVAVIFAFALFTGTETATSTGLGFQLEPLVKPFLQLMELKGILTYVMVPIFAMTVLLLAEQRLGSSKLIR